MPASCWRDCFCSLIENAEQMKTVTEFPLLFVNLFESQWLLSQHLGDVDKIAVPFNFAIVSYTSDDNPRVVLDGRQFGRVAAWRPTIHTTRRFSSQCFMRTLPIVLLQKQI